MEIQMVEGGTLGNLALVGMTKSRSRRIEELVARAANGGNEGL